MTQVLDVPGASSQSGARLQLWESNMSGAQQFYLDYNSEGTIRLTNLASGKSLDVPNGRGEAGVPVQQWDSNDSNAQRWILQKAEDGSYMLLAACNPSLALDACGASSANGTSIQLYGANGSSAQRFNFIPVDGATPQSTYQARDGFYSITFARDSSYALDVADASLESGASVALSKASNDMSQMFYVKRFSDGTYTLRAAHSGKALASKGGNVVPTTAVVQEEYNESDVSQRWCLMKNADGSIALVAAISNLALDVAGNNPYDGASVRLYLDNGTSAEKWNLTPVAGDGIETGICSITPACAPTRVVDVAGASYASGANVQIYDSNDTLAQRFVVERISASTAGQGAVYTFSSLLNGYYLTQENDNVVMRPALGASGPDNSQKWIASSLGFGGIQLTNARSGLALDVAGAANANGSNVGAYTVNGTSAQRFVVSPASVLSGAQTYAITSKLGDFALEVAGSSRSWGANIQLGTGSEANNQKFTAREVGDGYVFESSVSGLVIDVENGSTSPGANVRQWEANDSQAQQFILEPAGDGWFYLRCANGLYLDVAGAQASSGANVQMYAFNGSDAQKFRFIETSAYALSGDAELDAIVNSILDNQIGRDGNALYRAYSYVASFPYYSGSKYPTGDWSIPFAKEMYYNHGGNCYRYAALFCWLARGLGYDAQVVSGAVPSRSQGWAPHGWVEIYQNGTTYVCDPDLYHEYPSINWYMFTYSNAPTTYQKW